MPGHMKEIDPGVVKAAYAASCSARNMAERLGVGHHTTAQRMAKTLGLEIPAPHWSAHVPPAYSEPPEPPEVRHAHDLETQRLKDELADLKRKYTAAARSANTLDDVLAIARECFSRPFDPVLRKHPPEPRTGAVVSHEDAILTWADWHGYEVVNESVMHGWNRYDPIVMARRAQYTVDLTIQLLLENHAGTEFGTLYVFDLGDGINGDHLEEQMATNAATVFEAMRGTANLKAACLMDLARHFSHVVWVGVPGNHGRRGKKMQWKLPTETADWLMATMIQDRCAAQQNITVAVPQAWTVNVEIRGHIHSLNHGTAAASGGFGGISWYSYQRADGQLTAIEAAHGQHIAARWSGHIHQKAEVPMMDGEGEQFIVGSLKGGDEYALEGLRRFAPASQKLVGCHEDNAVSFRYPLAVWRYDDVPSRYEGIVT